VCYCREAEIVSTVFCYLAVSFKLGRHDVHVSERHPWME
jgi:hypothetical protein